MRKHLNKAFPYPPGRPIEEVQRMFGLKDVVKLASNENPLGPSPKALAAIRKYAAESQLYPDGDAFYLRQAIAEKHGVKPEQIIFGAGSDDLNSFIMTTFAGTGKNIVVSQGSFIRYEQCAIVSGASVKRVPFKKWSHDVPALLAAIDSKTAALCVANPENPVGTMLGKRQVNQLVKQTPDETLLLLDEAYYEFAVSNPDYPDSMQYLKKSKNVMVTRTFSKAYGLAGLRIGYGISTPEIVEALNRTRPPFNVTRLGQQAALAALQDQEHVRKTVELTNEGKAYYEQQFERLNLPYIKSYANFIAVNVGDGKAVFDALLPKGVIVRPLGGYGMNAWIRISIGLPRENKKCIAALEAVLRQTHHD